MAVPTGAQEGDPSALQTLVVPLAGESFAGYDLGQEIARGGMGMVFRARRKGTGADVAVKMILPFRLPNFGVVQRFRTEAEAVAKLDHPHILPIYEAGESHGMPFYSMKFAAGGSLAAALPSFTGKFKEVAALLAKVARGMQHAHERGIIHRDLKPANILLDEHGEPYVSDFGLAKILVADADEVSLTQTHAVIGTPHYGAPEQSSGAAGPPTPAADLYSLGAILYEGVSGQPPWFGATVFTVLRQSSENSAPHLRDVCPGAPAELALICDRCLQPEPALRYASAGAFAEDLERFGENRSLAPFRPPWRPRLRRWARRYKWALLALAGMMVAAGGLGLGVRLRAALPDIDLSGSRSPEAIYFLKRSLDINPSTNISDRGHLEATQEILQRALQADPNYAAAHAELSRVHSQLYWHFHDRSEARAMLAKNAAETALRLKPEYGRALLALAEYHFRVRREDARARQLLDQALRRSPNDPDIFNLVQLVAKRQGHWDESIAASVRLTELRPTNATDFFFLGINYDTIRRYADAQKAFDRAIYLAPERSDYDLARAYTAFRWRGDLSEMERWIARLPVPPPLSAAGAASARAPAEERGYTQFQFYRWKRNGDLMLRLAVSRPADWVYRDKTLWLPKAFLVAQARALRGEGDAARGEWENARRELEARAALPPDEARVRACLGLVYAQLGMKAEAVREGERAVALMPVAQEPVFGPEVQVALAEICLRSGEVGRGFALLRDALDRPGDFTRFELRLDPRWDFARSLPGYADLAADPPVR